MWVTVKTRKKEYKNISKKDEYVSDWTIPKMLKCKEVWLAAMVPTTFGLKDISVLLTVSQNELSNLQFHRISLQRNS